MAATFSGIVEALEAIAPCRVGAGEGCVSMGSLLGGRRGAGRPRLGCR